MSHTGRTVADYSPPPRPTAYSSAVATSSANNKKKSCQLNSHNKLKKEKKKHLEFIKKSQLNPVVAAPFFVCDLNVDYKCSDTKEITNKS